MLAVTPARNETGRNITADTLRQMSDSGLNQLQRKDRYLMEWTESNAELSQELGRRDGLQWSLAASSAMLEEAATRHNGFEMLDLYSNDPQGLRDVLSDIESVDFLHVDADSLCILLITQAASSFRDIVAEFHRRGYFWRDFGKNLAHSNGLFWAYEEGWISSVRQHWDSICEARGTDKIN